MRITLKIDDDVLIQARKIAATQKRRLGEVISSLARVGLREGLQGYGTRNGIPVLNISAGAPEIAPELVRQLEEEIQ